MAVQDQVMDGGISLGLTAETPYQPAAQNSLAPISPQFDSSNLPLHQMDYPGRPLSLPGHLTVVNSPEGRPPLSLPTFSGLQPENQNYLTYIDDKSGFTWSSYTSNSKDKSSYH